MFYKLVNYFSLVCYATLQSLFLVYSERELSAEYTSTWFLYSVIYIFREWRTCPFQAVSQEDSAIGSDFLVELMANEMAK